MTEQGNVTGNFDSNSDEFRLTELISALAYPNRESTGTPWTCEQIRNMFFTYGIAFTQWEVHFGFKAGMLSVLLKNLKMPKRGESHKAAVLIGMKVGSIVEPDSGRYEKMVKALGEAVRSELFPAPRST
jgi:gp16 family phage-associated protein